MRNVAVAIRATPEILSCSGLLHFIDHPLQLARHLGNGPALDSHVPIAVFADNQVQFSESWILGRKVFPEMGAPAFLSLQRRPGNSFRYREKAWQVQCCVPA